MTRQGDKLLQIPNTILAVIVLILFAAIIAFMFYGIGTLLPSIVITIPPILLARDIRDVIRGEGEKTYIEAFQRFLIMPFAITAWVSPCVAVRVIWDTYFYKLDGSTTIQILGITVPGFEVGDWFNYIAAGCGLFFSAWFSVESWKLADRRKKFMDDTSTSRIGNARPGVGEFVGVARHFNDKSTRQTRVSDNFTDKPAQDPIICWKKIDTIKGKRIESIINRFYIEDNTGRIMVDPREAELFDTGAMPSVREKTNIIVLERRVQRESADDNTFAKNEATALLPGDMVYVIGTIRKNPDFKKGDPESPAFMITPVNVQEKPGAINGILFNLDKHILSRNPKNMFILSDTAESYVKELLYKKSRSAFFATLIWAVPAVALLVVTFISS